MTRALAVGALLATLAGAAGADVGRKRKPIPPAPPPGPPDEIADDEAREANLESNAPREGLTFAGAVGFGILIGGDIGVGRGPALSLRLGHVATRKSVITFELVGSGGLHKNMTQTFTDSNVGLFAGVQRYASGSFWIRAAGGLDVFTANSGGGMAGTPHGGIGALFGAGLDIARWGYLVLGFESTWLASVTGDGPKAQLMFSTNLTYY